MATHFQKIGLKAIVAADPELSQSHANEDTEKIPHSHSKGLEEKLIKFVREAILQKPPKKKIERS
jgi:hypothetical protein